MSWPDAGGVRAGHCDMERKGIYRHAETPIFANNSRVPTTSKVTNTDLTSLEILHM